MTIITVATPEGRLTAEQRGLLSETLTDAVLVPEVGQASPPARAGFQVHFNELAYDRMAIGGRLLAAMDPKPDVMTIDVCVMDSYWPLDVRRQVIENVLSAMAKACDLPKASPTWWVTFRVIEDGSWGSRGHVLSIDSLLNVGVFSPERVASIQRARSVPQ